jgi:6,7-dimethyl-8-ribityllumazine synthase
MLVVSSYNQAVTDRLCAGAREQLEAAGWPAEQCPQLSVPGAWEIPLAVRWCLDHPGCVGVIAIGTVIRGETTHDQHLNRAVFGALMELGLSSGKPIGMGVLTVNQLDQAINRAGGTLGNKGAEAAEAVLQMLAARRQFCP